MIEYLPGHADTPIPGWLRNRAQLRADETGQPTFIAWYKGDLVGIDMAPENPYAKRFGLGHVAKVTPRVQQ